MRAIPSVVTLASLIWTAALAMVWWGDGTYAALARDGIHRSASSSGDTARDAHPSATAEAARADSPAPAALTFVHAGSLAILHMVVSFPVHLGGDVVRFFFDPDGGFLVTRFGLSNWLGLVAIVMFVVLLLTSTDGSLRWLGARRWKRLHLLAFAAAVLTALHALGYQTFRHAWVGLTGTVLVATVGLVSLRLVARRALAAPGLDARSAAERSDDP